MIERGTTESRSCANFFLNFLYRIRLRALTLKYKQCARGRDRALTSSQRSGALQDR